MKLLELILFEKYKNLKKNQQFKFKSNNILCIAGQNGSGKTNLFEIVSNILTVAALDYKTEQIVECELKLELKGKIILIINKEKKIKIYELENNERIEKEKEYLKNNLNIVLYSSAKRTPLSEMHYFEILEKIKNKNNLGDCYNYFIREKIKKNILIYLLLFNYDELKEVFQEFITIKEIKKLKIEIKSELKDILNKEQRDDVKKIIVKKNYNEIKNGVKVEIEEEGIKQITKFYKDNKFQFFSLLESLEKLNLIESLKKIEIQNDFSLDILSERVEDNYLSDKFFISKISLEEDININGLSDGELQLIETVGTILLFQKKEFKKETLYILDEPVTHLNVNWVSKYITLLKNVIEIKSADESLLKSQVIFSTHTSEIISDLPASNLLLIEKGEFKTIQEETFGSSEFKLNKILFNKTSSVSENVLNKINEYYKSLEETDTLEELEKLEEYIEITFGSSPEKYKLLKYAQDKILKMKKCD